MRNLLPIFTKELVEGAERRHTYGTRVFYAAVVGVLFYLRYDALPISTFITVLLVVRPLAHLACWAGISPALRRAGCHRAKHGLYAALQSR